METGVRRILQVDQVKVKDGLRIVLYKGQELAELMIYQVYYNDSQPPHLFPFSVPYKNEGLSIFFENDPIVKLVKATEADKISVCSWKLARKMNSRVGYRRPLTEEVLNSDYEVLSFTKNSSRHTMLAMANAWHKEFIPTIKLLWSKLGYKMPGEAKQPVYQNHYSAKSHIYKRYVNEFLSPAMELTLKDEELHERMMQPSGYGKLSREADVKSVKEKLGMTDYPLCPFILERCPSLFFDIHRIKVTYL